MRLLNDHLLIPIFLPFSHPCITDLCSLRHYKTNWDTVELVLTLTLLCQLLETAHQLFNSWLSALTVVIVGFPGSSLESRFASSVSWAPRTCDVGARGWLPSASVPRPETFLWTTSSSIFSSYYFRQPSGLRRKWPLRTKSFESLRMTKVQNETTDGWPEGNAHFRNCLSCSKMFLLSNKWRVDIHSMHK